jgi:PBP1b-binding outer membrane lipoprotein LpoB|tara:strand:- start:2157 stop:2675 length:519 start_codon:yes stop_codon:yes gene_type:complete
MKNLLLLPLLALFLTGCPSNENLTPEQAAEKKLNTILLVVENGVTFSTKTYLATVEDKEKVRGYFTDAASIINGLVTDGKVEPDVVKKYLSDGINEKVPVPFNTAVIGALDLGLSAYNGFYAANVKDNIANKDKAVKVLKAIAAGIESGVDPVSGDINALENPLKGYTDFTL